MYLFQHIETSGYRIISILWSKGESAAERIGAFEIVYSAPRRRKQAFDTQADRIFFTESSIMRVKHWK